ncbi:MAG TPA: hypothetical protein VGL92_06735, partial [Acidimicrobiia bacterium]
RVRQEAGGQITLMTPDEPDAGRYRRYLDREFDNAVLYRRLAEGSDGEHREMLLQLAAAEERHARYWQEKLAELGVTAGEVGQHRPTSVPAWPPTSSYMPSWCRGWPRPGGPGPPGRSGPGSSA